MVEGAVIDIARERDQALHRLQVIAAELRAHEQTVRYDIGSPRRSAGEGLRRLRHDNGGVGERSMRSVRPVGADRTQNGRGL